MDSGQKVMGLLMVLEPFVDPTRVSSVPPVAHQWRIKISCCMCVSVFFSFLSCPSPPHTPQTYFQDCIVNMLFQ